MDLLDVAEEVLSRLTVKDVLRCKSVCKSWCSLISSPSFVKLHLKHNCNKEYNDNKQQLGTRRIAMTNRCVYWDESGCGVPEDWCDYSDLNMEGSSNGLVCMSSFDNRICLTNPSTREFRKLPKPPVLPKTPIYPQTCFLDRPRFDATEPGILYNGALHWFSLDANDMKKVIVSFDLAIEQFREISQPNDTRYVWSRSNQLGTIEDCLCIFLKCKDGVPRRIWVMKNYNVEESWKLLPNNYEMKDRVHYMIRDSLLSRNMPSYFCCEDTYLSITGRHIWSPIFVQTLVSPYINNHGRPSDAKKNKWIVEARNSKKKREREEVNTLKDGEKNAILDKYVLDRERKKRKLMLLYKRFKGNQRLMYSFYKRRGHA